MAHRNTIARPASLAAAAGMLILTGVAGAQPQMGPQVRIDTGGTRAANETTISTSEFNPREIVAGWNDYRVPGAIRCGIALSQDGGWTWTDFLLRPPAQFQTSVEGDPMTCYDNRTGTLWAGAIAFGGNGGIYTARKNPGDSAFQPSVMARASGGADKGWMAAGPLPGNPDSTRVYIAYNEGLMRSSDMGDSWQGPVSLGSGLGFLPRVGPSGRLYILYWDWTGNGDRIRLRTSDNGGVSVSAPQTIATRLDVWGIDGSRYPGSFRVPPLPYLAVDPNDETLYVVWFDTTNIVNGSRNTDLYFIRSTDQGATWSAPTIINDDPEGTADSFFPWLEVDRDGRIHLVTYDTRNVPQNDWDPVAWVDAYYMYSDDKGDTWTEVRLTPAPFNSELDGRGGGTSFIGDYSGLAVGGARVYPCYLSNQNGDSDIFIHAINWCIADFNNDGLVNTLDFTAYLNAWAAGDPSADMNGDTVINSLDFLLFLNLWTEGC